MIFLSVLIIIRFIFIPQHFLFFFSLAEVLLYLVLSIFLYKRYENIFRMLTFEVENTLEFKFIKFERKRFPWINEKKIQ